MAEQSFDLIIVGGGLVGTGLALALSETGIRLALIEAQPPLAQDERLFALNHASCQFLTQLGLWPTLAEASTPIHEVHVSRQKHFGSVRLQNKTVGLAQLGHVIPARQLETALHHALTPDYCTVYRPATLTALTQHPQGVSLSIKTETETCHLQSAIVIGADGHHSTVRQQLNIAVDSVDYQQSAIVTRTGLSKSHQHIAYERFTATGAIAMLPLKGNECATIWSADQTTADQLLALSDHDFLQALQKAWGYKLGRLQYVRSRHTYPLKMQCAKQSVAGRVLLIGNAAHTLHPIAAQGFNLALYEVATLVARMKQKQKTNQLLTPEDLQDVVRQTQKQIQTSRMTSHHLAEFFMPSSSFMSIFTQLGMLGFDMLTPIKRQFMTRLLGKKNNHQLYLN